MIHSAPLRLGASLMMPTSASSAQTRRTGLCLVIRAESSFSRCSGARVDNAARGGALNAIAKRVTRAGVKVFENRRCSDEMI